MIDLMCRQEYVAMGLYHIAKAVSFINSDCKLVSMVVILPYAQIGGSKHSSARVIST